MGILLALLLVAMLYFGSVVQAVVFSLGAIIAVHEMLAVFAKKGVKPFAAPLYFMAAVLGAWLLLLPNLSYLYLLAICAVVTMAEFIFNRKRTLEACLASFAIFVYPTLFLVMLLETGIRFGALGTTALLSAFACPLLGDILAYFVGTAIGKHKLCPEISPHKTVEGGIASLFGSVLGGVVAYFAQPLWGEAYAPLWLLLAIGAVCGVAGQIGDLFASGVKRWAGIKDFGKIFPGHGGVLDRVDSVLFCAPVIYLAFFAYTNLI